MSKQKKYPARGPVSAAARSDIRWYVDSLYDTQDLATQNTNRRKARERGVDTMSDALAKDVEARSEQLASMEAALLKSLKGLVEAHPAGSRFHSVRGLGPSLGAKLIGLTDKTGLQPPCEKHQKGRDPNCEDCFVPNGLVGAANFATPSKLMKFAGLAVVDGRAQHPEEGVVRNYNARLKSLILGPLAEQFVRLGGPYRERIYDPAKERYAQKPLCPEHGAKQSYRCPTCWTKMHVERTARRKMGHLFLCHYWEVWRLAEGLPIRASYVHDYLGHPTVLSPAEFGWDMTGLKVEEEALALA